MKLTFVCVGAKTVLHHSPYQKRSSNNIERLLRRRPRGKQALWISPVCDLISNWLGLIIFEFKPRNRIFTSLAIPDEQHLWYPEFRASARHWGLLFQMEQSWAIYFRRIGHFVNLIRFRRLNFWIHRAGWTHGWYVAPLQVETINTEFARGRGGWRAIDIWKVIWIARNQNVVCSIVKRWICVNVKKVDLIRNGSGLNNVPKREKDYK